MSNSVEVRVPDIGGDASVTVVELLVSVGDTVAMDDPLLAVESDKATMEIPSTAAGVVAQLLVGEGDAIAEGTVIAELQPVDTTAGAREQPPAGAMSPECAAAPADPSSSSITQLHVPDLGGASNVEVIDVLVATGDTIHAEQALFVVESDKSTMEVPAEQAGTLTALHVEVGKRVNEGDLIAEMAVLQPSIMPQAAAPERTEAAPTASRTAATLTAPGPRPHHAPSTSVDIGILPYSSPSVRLLARELNVPLTEVTGSGKRGRITREDVQSYVQGIMQQRRESPAADGCTTDGPLIDLLPWPKVDFEGFGPVIRQPRSRIRKISAANLHRNWVTIPHVTNHEDADITTLEAFRKRMNRELEGSGHKLTLLAFLIKSAVFALKQFPEFNASLDGDDLVLKNYYHIGFAADTPDGLLVPVIRDADKKGVIAIADEARELAIKARAGKLTAADMSGGCFSISSLGGIGGTYFTPIINAPEIAILGVGRAREQVQWHGNTTEPRLVLPMSLSWDHRAIDGAMAGRFNACLAGLLADFQRVSL